MIFWKNLIIDKLHIRKDDYKDSKYGFEHIWQYIYEKMKKYKK